MSSGAAPAILLFPSGIDQFSTKVNNGQSVYLESQIIPINPSFQLYLNYVPLFSGVPSVNITGNPSGMYTEVSGVPATFQFNVVYSGANAGLVTFNALQSGLSILATYTAFGDSIKAEMINSIQTGLVDVETYILNNFPSGAYLANSGGSVFGAVSFGNNISISGNVNFVHSGTTNIGSINAPANEIFSNNLETNNIVSPLALSIGSIGNLTLSGSSIIADASVVPAVSGISTLGSSSSAWSKLYVDQISKSFTLASGVNIVVLASGSNSIGGNGAPISSIYADNIVAGNISSPSMFSGSFVPTSGGTMTGNLIITSGNQLNTFLINNSLGDLTMTSAALIRLAVDAVPTFSGINNLGSAAYPFDTLYVKNIDGGTISGNFVSKNGDTMNGNLVFPLGTFLDVVNIGSASPSGDLTFNVSQLDVDANSYISFNVASSAKLQVGLSAIFVAEDIIPTSSGSFSLGSASQAFANLYANNIHFNNMPSGAILNNVTLEGQTNVGGNIVPLVSGTINLGASGLSFGTIYANQIITSVSSGTYIQKNGDTVNGSLTFASGASVLTSVSGVNNVGSSSVPFNTIYANNIVSPGFNNTYVTTSGGTMTGPLVVGQIFGNSNILISGVTTTIEGQQLNLTSTNGPILINGNTEVQTLINGMPIINVSSSGLTTYAPIIPGSSGSNLGSINEPFNTLYINSIVEISGQQRPDNEDAFYRYDQQPLLHWVNNASVLTSTNVAGAANYGTWDGEYFWIGSFGPGTISKIDQNGSLLKTYIMPSGIKPLQLAWDNQYIWVGSADISGTLIKFDPVAETVAASYVLNPSAVGNGGVQGLLWDGINIWAGVAQQGAGPGSGLVIQINPSDGSFLQSISGNINVNGMTVLDIPEPAGVQRYIFAACTGFINKIKVSDGSSITYSIPTNDVYRICTDGYYIYGAEYGIFFGTSNVYKISALTGDLVADWATDSGSLNSIEFDGKNIWIVGNNDEAHIYDRSGSVIDRLFSFGRNSLVFDGSYMWAVDSSGNVKKAFVGEIAGNSKIYENFAVMTSGHTLGFNLSTKRNVMEFHGNNISGVNNILNNVSGVGIIGSVSSPFAAIYANNIFGASGIGYYVPISGGTMVGPLYNNVISNAGAGYIFISGSVAEGINNILAASNVHAEGTLNLISGNNSHAEGSNNIVVGTSAHAEGHFTSALGNDSHSEGTSTTAQGSSSHSEGSSTTATGTNAHAEGGTTNAFGFNSHSEGSSTTAFATASHAEGNQTAAHGNNSHAEGDATITYGNQAHAQGVATVASGSTSFAAGQLANANGDYSVAIAGWSGTANGTSSWIFADYDVTKDTSNNIPNSLLMRFSNGVYLNNGTNLFPGNSGVNTIGSASLPFSGAYFNTVYQSTVKVISNYTASLINTNILTAQTATMTVGIPVAQIGKEYKIIATLASNTHNVIVSGIGCTIDGVATKTINSSSIGAACYIISDGNNYFSLNNLI